MSSVEKYEIKPTQSTELLKALHILTRDGKLNQDSKRKLKQVYHLVQFIEPLMADVLQEKHHLTLVDHGSGKSYLGFILNDLYCKLQKDPTEIYCIDIREDLIKTTRQLAQQLSFKNMHFLHLSAEQSLLSDELPSQIDIVTALHACNTATDDALLFALAKQAKHIAIVPCCQAEVAAVLRENKRHQLKNNLVEIWRHPIHTRELGSHLTNVLRCLQLESHGYQVTVTELVGWEHSLKNELIIASRQTTNQARIREALRRKEEILKTFGLDSLSSRFQ